MTLSYCGLPKRESSSCFTAMSHVKSQMAHHDCLMVWCCRFVRRESQDLGDLAVDEGKARGGVEARGGTRVVRIGRQTSVRR